MDLYRNISNRLIQNESDCPCMGLSVTIKLMMDVQVWTNCRLMGLISNPLKVNAVKISGR